MADRVTGILIGFSNPAQVFERVKAFRTAGADEIILVDNGSKPLVDIRKDVDVYLDGSAVPWAGPAIYEACRHASHPTVVYACSHHLTIRRDTWLRELVAPIVAGYALAGDIRELGFGPAALGLPFCDTDLAFRYHVQGGLWAGHRDTLRKCAPDPKYPHGYEDVVRTWKVLNLGGRLASVPTIFSTGVRGEVCQHPERYSAIHDYHL